MAFALLVVAAVGLADWVRGFAAGVYPALALPIDCLGTALVFGGLGILIVGKPVRRVVKEIRSLRFIEMVALAVIWSVISFLFYSSIFVSLPAKVNPLTAPQPNFVSAFLLANVICIFITNFVYRHLPPALYGKAS
jgi:hypothetical protein